MLQVSDVIGLDRIGAWQRSKSFTPRGRYENADPMAGVGRLVDWLECSCLFDQKETIAKADIVDELVDSGVLQAADGESIEETAEEIADATLQEVRRRSLLMEGNGPYSFPFLVERSIMKRRVGSWHEASVYGFMLLATMGHLARWIRDEGTTDHEVGHLFEQIVSHGAEGLFGRPAAILETSRRGEDHLSDRVRVALMSFQRELTNEIVNAPQRIRDGGLDVVARLWNHGNDSRPGRAHFLVQCASGADWKDKLGHPVVSKWREWVSWRGPIYKAFAVPFVFTDDGTLSDASRDGEWTLVLDRSRLLHGVGLAGPVPAALSNSVEEWCKNRLPELSKRGLLVKPGMRRRRPRR